MSKKLFVDWTNHNSPYFSHQKVYFSFGTPDFHLASGVSEAELHKLRNFFLSLFMSSDTKGRIISLSYGNGLDEIEIQGGEYDEIKYLKITDYGKICIKTDIFVPICFIGSVPYDHPIGRKIYSFEIPVVVIEHQNFRYKSDNTTKTTTETTDPPHAEKLDDLEGEERFC